MLFIVGSKNKDCLCATCERKGVNGYGPAVPEGEDVGNNANFPYRAHDSDSDSDDSSSIASLPEQPPQAAINVDERSTRRGVYHILPKQVTPQSTPPEATPTAQSSAPNLDTISIDDDDEVEDNGSNGQLLSLWRVSDMKQ
jgi:histone-lysine N-methyltransferase SUV420H